MPYADAVAASDAFRAALLAKERASATRLVRAYGEVYRRLQTQIEGLTTELDTLAAKGELSPARVARLERLKSLERQITEEVGRYAVYAEQEVVQGSENAIAQAQRDAKALTQAALPGLAPVDAQIMARWQQLNPEAVQSLLGFLAEDSPLRQGMLRQLGPAVAEQVGQKLIEGIALGYNPRKVAAIIRQEMGLGLTSSLRTARTAQLWAYREGSRASYLANSEIVEGWQWHSAKLPTTCMSCLAKDGSIHPLSEPLADHWNGKCSALPWLGDQPYKRLGLNVEVPADDEQTGRQWFESLPEARQVAMMGKEKHAAWRAGQFDFEQLSKATDDKVWGQMFVETPLKDLVPEREAA